MHISLSFSRAVLRTFVTVSACSAMALRAQTPAAPGGPVQLGPMVIQGRATDLIGSASSASQGILGAAELGARPFLRRGELLEVIPGVVITQHSGDGKANQYFLRGFNLDHGTDFSVAVDGMPVNMRSHAHGQGYADLNFLIPELVRQVDYSKGPFHAEVGDFSAAGAAEFRQFDALPGDFLTVALGENRYARIAGGATRRDGTTEDTAALEFTHDDGPWALRENSNRFNGLLRRHWVRGDADYRITAMGYRGRWRSTDQIPLRAVDRGTLERFGYVDPTDGGDSERYSVSLEASFKSPDATTRLNAYAVHYGLNLFSNFTYFLDDPVAGDQFNQRDRRTLVGAALTRSWSGSSGKARTETTFGGQVRADFIGELGLFRTAERVRLATIRADDVTEASAGAFAKAETRWNEWLRTNAGIRADGYRFEVESDEARNSGRKTAGIVSPKFGAVVGPWRKTEFYANAGYGFHSNDARGTTLRVDPVDGAPAEPVTPLARSRGAELGLRTAFLPGLVSSVSLWALDLESELVFVGDAGGTEPTGRTRRTGVEFANFYRLGRWIALDADLSLTHARYRDDAGTGTRIANSIDTVVTAGATIGADQGFFGALRLRYFGPQPLIEDDSVRAPSSTTINARVGWRSRRWDAALEILNVLDRANHDIAYFYRSRLRGEPVDGVDDIHFHPAEPRTLRLSVTRHY
jgi:hypothetical protein